MMHLLLKRIRTGAVAVLVAAPALLHSQTYALAPGDSMVVQAPFNDLNHYLIEQHNLTGSPLFLGWEQVSVLVPSGWTAYLCDLGNCFTGFPQSGVMDTVHVSEYGLLSVAVDPVNIPGTAVIRYAVWDLAFPAQRDTLTWVITASATAGTGPGAGQGGITVFPTLASAGVTVQSLPEAVFELAAVDANGRVVCLLESRQGELYIDVSGWTAGIYFIRFRDGNGNFFSRKIIVIH